MELTEMQRDFLREMANIGAGNASTVLSEAVGREVKLTVSRLNIISLKQLSELVRASKKLVVTVFTSIGGAVLGSVILIFPIESAFSLVDLLRRRGVGTTKLLSMEAQGVLRRASLSLLRCYLDAITKFLNIEVQPERPRLVATLSETIMDFVQMSMKERLERILMLKTELKVEPDIRGEYYLLLKENIISFLPTK